MLPNPWLILAVLVAIGLAGFGGYKHGINTERGDAAIEHQRTITNAFETWDKDAEAETARRVEVATENARVAGVARDAKLRGQQDAAKNDRPDCRWPERRRLLINAAVAAANGAPEDAAADRVLHPMPDAAATGR